jgi:hypothetical protein
MQFGANNDRTMSVLIWLPGSPEPFILNIQKMYFKYFVKKKIYIESIMYTLNL